MSQAPSAARGRPKGAITRVFRSDSALGLHHFAFLRAQLHGMDAHAAWERYMAHMESSDDLRVIKHHTRSLFDLVLERAKALDGASAHAQTLGTYIQALERRTDQIQSAQQSVRVHEVPTLDQWLETVDFDPSEWSESELIEHYKQAVGLGEEEPQAPLSALKVSPRQALIAREVDQAISALNHLGNLLAQRPAPLDACGLWFSARTAAQLASVQVHTLGQLHALLHRHGFYWWRTVRGIGQIQAARIVQFVHTIEDGGPLCCAVHVLVAPKDNPSNALQVVPGFGIKPLEYLHVPSMLLGLHGRMRTHMPNTLDANDDRQAIEAWLSKYRERPHTLRAYRKEVERFYLWCLHGAKKALSDITTNDCLAYRAFLRQIPTEWIYERPCPRHSPQWRPFRGPLEPSSQKQALVIVQTLFEDLQSAGYLVANPMRMVFKGFDLPSSRIHIERSLTQAQWDYLIGALHLVEDTTSRLRMRTLLELLGATGVRLFECTYATWSQVLEVPLQGSNQTAHVIQVLGKRSKVREVPLPPDVLDLLRAHARSVGIDPAQEPHAPLIARCANDQQFGALSRRAALPSLGSERHPGAMSCSGLAHALKRYVRRVCAHAALDPTCQIDVAHLHQASAHWLRHTFARQSAASDVPLEVLQQALGHESLNTTSVYLNTERTRMIEQLYRARTQRQERTATP